MTRYRPGGGAGVARPGVARDRAGDGAHRRAGLPLVAASRPRMGRTRGFPTIAAACRAAGLDLARDLIPVGPAAHYMMGGVETDIWGRTTPAGVVRRRRGRLHRCARRQSPGQQLAARGPGVRRSRRRGDARAAAGGGDGGRTGRDEPRHGRRRAAWRVGRGGGRCRERRHPGGRAAADVGRGRGQSRGRPPGGGDAATVGAAAPAGGGGRARRPPTMRWRAAANVATVAWLIASAALAPGGVARRRTSAPTSRAKTIYTGGFTSQKIADRAVAGGDGSQLLQIDPTPLWKTWLRRRRRKRSLPKSRLSPPISPAGTSTSSARRSSPTTRRSRAAWSSGRTATPSGSCIQRQLDDRFKATGHVNAYFPLLHSREPAHAGGGARRRLRAAGRLGHQGRHRGARGKAHRPADLGDDLRRHVPEVDPVVARSARADQPVGERRPLGKGDAAVPAHDRIPVAGRAHRARDRRRSAGRDAQDPRPLQGVLRERARHAGRRRAEEREREVRRRGRRPIRSRR